MHSKQTVKYVCKSYPSGNQYYYKLEVITHDSWEKIESLDWSAPRPISKSTFEKRQKEGYKVEYIKMSNPPAEVIPFIKK
ncbi:hypothetical protein [Halalkalibacter akibai]|uniref:Uncharacterized protein n=1 Tax=Halalkalibacter akibai (strain ATCC 43226 / DSM 21942 / CIP 109018 / JCM 9157 / 1139) TaxID=1236973 RepID=W4QN56_HALA3|nr:hypothetical protein [Halalkalibacter akibai]GAE33506.1 hypothetical protein JCM9157_510 [Halalkalibacter akibai JCM 9157]